MRQPLSELVDYILQQVSQMLAERGFVGNRLSGGSIRGQVPVTAIPPHPHDASAGSKGQIAYGDLSGLPDLSALAMDAEVADAFAAHAGAADPHAGYQLESEKGQANGYPSLGTDGLVPASQLPAASSGGIVVREADGSPSVSGVTTLEVSGATVTDQTGGVVRITVTGGTGGGAPTDYPYLGFGAHANLSAGVDVRSLGPVNEVKGWPPYVPVGSNLAASGASPQSLWWRDDAGSVAITLVSCTAEGLPTTYGDYALKCVAAGATNGPAQTWTYSEEPRVKSGVMLSALVAVYMPAGRTATARLTDSAGASDVTAASTTTAAWERLALEGKACAGTWAKLKVLPDAACTFYVVPLGANLGSRGLSLGPRPTRWVDYVGYPLVDVDPGGADWTDSDITTHTSPLAFRAQLNCVYYSSDTNAEVFFRRKGSADAGLSVTRTPGNTYYAVGNAPTWLSDGQVWQYKTGRPAATNEHIYLHTLGYEEYA